MGTTISLVPGEEGFRRPGHTVIAVVTIVGQQGLSKRRSGAAGSSSREMMLERNPSTDRVQRSSTMGIGPVEYGVVAFPGNKFKGEIAPALEELVKSGTIRIIDLAFVLKDEDGNVAGVEVEDAGSEVLRAFEAITYQRDGLISDDDLAKIGAALDPNSSALVMVWEDLWATRLAEAVRNAGGIVVDIQRVPYEIVQEAIDFAKTPVGAES
jgi:uncharacterized membrane protein